MSQDPLPGPVYDGKEPGGCAPPAAAVSGLADDDWDGEAAIDSLVAQVDAGECEPPGWLGEDLAGEEMSTAGFAPGGLAEGMGPGPVLGALVHDAAGHGGQGLAGLSEDELLGVLTAARRLESRAVWTSLSAIAEYAARAEA